MKNAGATACPTFTVAVVCAVTVPDVPVNVITGVPVGVNPVLVIVSAADTGFPSSTVADPGHAMSVTPVHAKLTLPVNPPKGVTVTVVVKGTVRTTFNGDPHESENPDRTASVVPADRAGAAFGARGVAITVSAAPLGVPGVVKTGKFTVTIPPAVIATAVAVQPSPPIKLVQVKSIVPLYPDEPNVTAIEAAAPPVSGEGDCAPNVNEIVGGAVMFTWMFWLFAGFVPTRADNEKEYDAVRGGNVSVAERAVISVSATGFGEIATAGSEEVNVTAPGAAFTGVSVTTSVDAWL